MSHCLGTVCEIHGWMLQSDSCPEPGCSGKHGYTMVPCQDPCPEEDVDDEG